MPRRIDALDVARYIVDECHNKKIPITNLQLQKILYYVQYYFLKYHNTPLFDDDFEAREFGPVVPGVYREYRIFKGSLLDNRFDLSENKNYKGKVENYIPQQSIERSALKDFKFIIDKTSNMFLWDLVKATHKKEKAWHKSYSGEHNRGIIDKQLIKDIGF